MKSSFLTAARMLRLAVFAFVVLWGHSALATTSVVQVGNCHNKVGKANIHDAVTAVSPGGTIFVCPGTYPEQVLINKPLTMTGIQDGTSDAAVIVPPATGLVFNTTRVTSLLSGGTHPPEAVQVLITAATGKVNLSNLTIDGAGNKLNSPCSGSTLMAGIYYRVASGTVTNVATRNQIIDAAESCGNGDAILAESGGTSSSPIKTSVTIQQCSVRAWQTLGIGVNDFSIAAIIKQNTISGPGVSTFNGIQLVGATGLVYGNSIIGNGGDNSTGILAEASHGVQIIGNTVGNEGDGIAVLSDDALPGDANNSLVAWNVVFDNPSANLANSDAGIGIGSNNNQVFGNEINGSAGAAIFVTPFGNTTFTSTNNSILLNSINEACAGILLGTAGNTTFFNQFFNVFETVANGTTCADPPPQVHVASAANVQGSAAERESRAKP